METRKPIHKLFDAYPEVVSVPVQMGTVTYRRENLDPAEQHALGALAQILEPKRIMEIGTFDGATTAILARNAPDAEILTLDLPPDQAAVATVAAEVANNAREGVGARFRGTPDADRITQLYGDSTRFDFTPWYGTVDLVFVDAGHEYDAVASDTMNALKLRSSNGIIVWDDYCVYWPGVMQAVDELAPGAFRLHGTEFAVFDPTRHQ